MFCLKIITCFLHRWHHAKITNVSKLTYYGRHHLHSLYACFGPISLPIQIPCQIDREYGVHDIFADIFFSRSPKVGKIPHLCVQSKINNFNLIHIIMTNIKSNYCMNKYYLREGLMISICLPFIHPIIHYIYGLIWTMSVSVDKPTCLCDHGWMLKSLFKPGLI